MECTEFTGFHGVLSLFIEFFQLSVLGFTELNQVLPGFTGFYWVLLGLRWHSMEFTEFQRNPSRFCWLKSTCRWTLPSYRGFNSYYSELKSTFHCCCVVYRNEN